MQITLNNRPENIGKSSVTVKELLNINGFTFKMLVIKINGKLVKKSDYHATSISDGDVVQVLHLVSGG